jgi:hypothetical protein
MECQKARIIEAPPPPFDKLVGKEIWMLADPPEHREAVYSHTQEKYVDHTSGYLTPYRRKDGWFGPEAHTVELLARGPEDFADLSGNAFMADWLKENGIDYEM